MNGSAISAKNLNLTPVANLGYVTAPNPKDPVIDTVIITNSNIGRKQ